MSRPLQNRLSRRATQSFVGREQELASLLELLNDDGPVVAYLYGIPGVGKSTLLSMLAQEAQERGAVARILDCRLMEPTERGFFTELGALAGEKIDTLEAAVNFLGKSATPVILGLDHYETFLLMDTWLRQVFLPALPEHVRLAVTSRQPPVPLWLTSSRWHGLFRALAVESLSHNSALTLLEQAGLDPAEAEPLAAVTHGNPLALKLAASAALARPSITLEDAAVQEVMQELTGIYLDDVEDRGVRKAIELTSVARRITRSLLRALDLGDDEHWDGLRQLPFVDSWRDGLRVHDAVREAVARSLRASDPERYLESRRTAWLQLRDEVRSSARSELWRYTADMLYLIENPVVREAFFPSGHKELAVEPALPEDREEIRRLTARHEGPEASSIMDVWWQHQSRAFRVARNREGRIVAFYAMCEARELKDPVPQADTLVASWCQHLENNPPSETGHTLFLRRWLGEPAGEAPSPEQAACWLDIKRTYMELRPNLRRVYITVVDVPTYAPVATELGFRLISKATKELDGSTYSSAMLDFGPGSVDGWITRLVGEELGLKVESLLDRSRRALTLDGEHITLTPLEFKLADYLEGRDGATATRDDILTKVWGNSYLDGSSNVVDAVVKTLRRKLGKESGRLETVRGFGYRWRQTPAS